MKDGPNMIVLDSADNVGIALSDIGMGETAADITGHGLVAMEAIPQGHKIAIVTIPSGDRVRRFGVPVAIATSDIGRGQLVHVHNVRSQYLDNDHDHFE